MKVNPIVRQIVSRCHVSESYDDVLKYVISRLDEGEKTFDGMSPENQIALKNQVEMARKENIDLYNFVMR